MEQDLDAFYRDFVQNAPDAVVYSDDKGIIRIWNSGAERIFGYSVQEAVGQTLDIIIPEKLRDRHWQGYDKTMETGTSRYGAGSLLSVPALRKDGTRISVEFTIVPFADADGHMLGIGAMMRDVTKQFEDMRALRKEFAALKARCGADKSLSS